MKKYIIFILSIICLTFTKVNATNVKITDIELDSKSDTTLINNEATYKDLNISTDTTFTKVDDYVKYKITIKNNDSKDYELDLNNSVLDNEYIKYEVEDNTKDIIPKNAETTIYLLITYAKDVPNDKLTKNEFDISDSVVLSLKGQSLIDNISKAVNPNTKTGKALIVIVMLFIISMIAVFKNYKKAKYILPVLLLLFTTTVYAIEKLEIVVDSKIVIDKEVATLSKEKFKDFANTNNPTKISFVNTGASEGTDISEEQNGSILAWMDDDTMYISRSKANRYVNAPEDSSKLFTSSQLDGWQTKITDLDVTYLNTSNVTNMYDMFWHCDILTSLDLSSWDTSNVTNMNSMFDCCLKLTNLNISNFDTSNVTSMSGMFWNCKLLPTLDLSNFDTSNVTNMSLMFCWTEHLTSLNISSFDTSKVTSMYGMFQGSNRLSSLDLSNFDTSNVTNMSNMFNNLGYYSDSLTLTGISDFDTSKVTTMSQMFEYFGFNAKTINLDDISKWNTSNVNLMTDMFYEAGYNVTSFDLDLSGWDVSNVNYNKPNSHTNEGRDSLTGMNYMFAYSGYNSTSYSLNLTGWKPTSTVDMSYMFAYAGYKASTWEIKGINDFDTSSATNMNNMFLGCKNMKTLDISNFNTSKVTNLTGMFSGCTNLTSLTIPKTNGNGINNTVDTIYGSTTDTSYTLTMEGRTVTLK